jgi:membrane fusion protein (multidrug efflux system)
MFATRCVLVAAVLSFVTGCRDVPERPVMAAGSAATMVAPDSVVRIGRERISTGPAISGEIRARREATVRAEVAGSVIGGMVEEGQAVTRGQVLCRIDAAALRDARTSAEVGVRSAADALTAAQRDEARLRSLAAEGLVAARDVEKGGQAIAQAEAQLAEAQARLAAAGEQARHAVVRAPFTGVVSSRTVNTGDVVAPGAPLMSIIDPSSMQLEAAVPSDALDELRIAAPVEFRIAGSDEVFRGRIERISPVADPVTRQVRIHVSIPNSSRRLVAGLFAEGRVMAESRETLVAPAAAVDMHSNTPSVMRLRDGTAEQVPVQIGLRDERGSRVEIRLGLAEGDALLIGAAQAIAPGTPVQLANSPRVAVLR